MHTRSLALDALRGIAICGMVLSGSVAYNGVLPAWMYHAQVPPPAYRFNPALPGITWVDLVFPFFLFALGAAIPLAFANKTIPQTPREYVRAGWAILKRGLLLAWFAIVTKHARTYALSAKADAAQPEVAWFHALVAIVCFVLMFPALMRSTTSVKSVLIQTAAIAAITGILLFLEYPTHKAVSGLQTTVFDLFHSDIILLLLSNVAVFGTAIWLATRTNTLLRLGLLGFFLALRFAEPQPNFAGSWQHWLWFATPAAWLFKVYYLQYLFNVLIGTIAGDLMVSAAQTAQAQNVEHSHGSKNPFSLNLALKAALLLVFTVVNLFGLFARELNLNLVLNLVLLAAGFWLFRPSKVESEAQSALQTLHRRLYNWGAYWLLLGLFFEAFEGGIKKDKSTLSYYFVTSGLAFFWLAALSVLLAECKLQRGFQTIIANGQNPMVAYVTGGMLLLPLLHATGAEPWFNAAFGASPLLAFLRGVIFTSVVMLITLLCSRRGWLWRT
jgi:predicted acyltransferase